MYNDPVTTLVKWVTVTALAIDLTLFAYNHAGWGWLCTYAVAIFCTVKFVRSY